MDKQKCRGRKEDSEQKLANQNNGFPLRPVHFYLSIEAYFLRFIHLFLHFGDFFSWLNALTAHVWKEDIEEYYLYYKLYAGFPLVIEGESGVF